MAPPGPEVPPLGSAKRSQARARSKFPLVRHRNARALFQRFYRTSPHLNATRSSPLLLQVSLVARFPRVAEALRDSRAPLPLRCSVVVRMRRLACNWAPPRAVRCCADGVLRRRTGTWTLCAAAARSILVTSFSPIYLLYKGQRAGSDAHADNPKYSQLLNLPPCQEPLLSVSLARSLTQRITVPMSAHMTT